MTATFFIDESGGTGDLAKTGPDLAFGDQPIFTLACVGLAEDDGLAEEIQRLKARHRVAASELKSSQLHNRPAFVLDVLAALADGGCPVMVEVVEKRFMVAIHIVNHQLMTGAHHVGDPNGEALANALAEFLGQAAPDAVFAAFAEACLAPSATSVTRSLSVLRDWGRGFRPAFELTEIVTGLASLALEELEPGADADHPYSYRRFLPSPDDGPSGKPMWMLPGLSCFTNIYARLNLMLGGRLDGVTIVHDEQRYVEGALRDGKQMMEVMRADMTRFSPRFADYQVGEAATLEFRSSHDALGLQVADLIAGTMMRHMKTVLAGAARPWPLAAVARSILTFEDAQRGLGVNFVVTGRLLARAGIRTF